MHHSTNPPTKAEAEYIAKVKSLGCCACATLDLWCPSDAAHHILSGGKRMGHAFVLPLCDGHHLGKWRWEQQDCMPADKLVSISSGSYSWRKAYPSQRALWELVRLTMKLPIDIWPTSKVLPRRLEIVT